MLTKPPVPYDLCVADPISLSRGLLRDYEPSDAIRMELFEALISRHCVQGTVGKCECRRDMRWNSAEGECQIFLDVDCSRITYDTRPSTAGTRPSWHLLSH